MRGLLHDITPLRAAQIDRQADTIRDFALAVAALRFPRDGLRNIEFGGRRYLYDSATGLVSEVSDKPGAR